MISNLNGTQDVAASLKAYADRKASEAGQKLAGVFSQAFATNVAFA